MKADLRAILLPALILSALAGCGEKKQEAPSHATAVGEVLPGSVSDAMLPVDTVRSQPPLAPRVEASGGKGDRAHGPGKGAPDTDTGASDAAAEPAAEPPAEVPPAAPPAQ